MYRSVALLCAAVMFINGASSDLYPRARVNTYPVDQLGEIIKRQANGGCFSNKLDELFEGTDSAASDCKLAALEELALESNFTEDAEELLDFIFSILCSPECGLPVVEAFEECGIFDLLPGFRRFAVGICATNSKGEKCYERYQEATGFYLTEAECYINYLRSGVCQCKTDLERAVEELGCCINVYHSFYEGLNATLLYIPRELYIDACGVALPKDCSNSPIKPSSSVNGGSSNALPSTIIIIAAAFLFYALY